METSEYIKRLVGKAQRGDSGAFDQIVLRYTEHIRALVFSELGDGLRRRVEIDDLVQDTFLQAFRSIEQFRGEDDDTFRHWLDTIARRVVQGQARRMSAQKVDYHREVDSPVSNVKDEGDSPSKNLQREERFERLEEAMRALSPRYREVITLARLEGLPVKEVARRMGRSEKATSVLLVRAMLKLKDVFGSTESFHLPGRKLTEGDSKDDE